MLLEMREKREICCQCVKYMVTTAFSFHLKTSEKDSISNSSITLSPIWHCWTLSLILSQGQSTFPEVELQSSSLHQPVGSLQDLGSEGLRLFPLLWGLAAPGPRLGCDARRGGGRLGLLTDAIEVLHWVFSPLASSTGTAAGKHRESGFRLPESNWFAHFCTCSIYLR